MAGRSRLCSLLDWEADPSDPTRSSSYPARRNTGGGVQMATTRYDVVTGTGCSGWTASRHDAMREITSEWNDVCIAAERLTRLLRRVSCLPRTSCLRTLPS